MSEEERSDASGEDRCGHPTKQGGLCRRSPMAGSEFCHQHGDLEPTEEEKQASRRNPIKHGYFVSGFIDEREHAIFRAVVDGEVELRDIQRNVIAALVVRTVRMLKREAAGEDVTGLTTSAFAELRKSIETMDPESFHVEHTWSMEEIRLGVERLLQEDDELVLRMVPPEVRDVVEEAMP